MCQQNKLLQDSWQTNQTNNIEKQKKVSLLWHRHSCIDKATEKEHKRSLHYTAFYCFNNVMLPSS